MESNASNSVRFSDDELSLIQAALDLVINSTKIYNSKNGDGSLDSATKESIDQMKKLKDRLNREFF